MPTLNSRAVRRWIPILACLCAVGVPLGCTRRPATDPGLVSAWVHALYGAIRVERLSPPVASRLAAYAATALYGGLASVHPDMRALDGVFTGMPSLPRADRPGDYDATVVAVMAERVVLDSLLQEGLATTRAQLERLADSLDGARVAAGIAADVRARSDSLGRRIGLAIVAWSNTDGFTATRRAYAPPVGDGLWYNDSPATVYSTQNLSGASEFVALDNPANQQRAGNVSDRGLIMSRPKSASTKTLPAANMAGATEPYWREVRPFVLKAWNECVIPDPPAYSIDSASVLSGNARAVVDAKNALTPEQRTIAYYWADNAGESGTPVGHWMSIASQMISERHLTADKAAELVLATAVAQADAFIAAWGYKYQYNLLRPRTYIRRVIDSTWEPLIPTPPFPEHPAGHSTQSSAAATVITALIGASPFSDSTSVSIGHAVRHFDSFQAASEEAGRSRIYGGIHFPSGNESGLTLGRCVGAKVAAALGVETTSNTGKP
ncbi:MAG: vanadium-dependent haloperoxidase [Gemmatimonas sp.]